MPSLNEVGLESARQVYVLIMAVAEEDAFRAGALIGLKTPFAVCTNIELAFLAEKHIEGPACGTVHATVHCVNLAQERKDLWLRSLSPVEATETSSGLNAWVRESPAVPTIGFRGLITSQVPLRPLVI